MIKVPTTSACPTLTDEPRAYEAWFNVDDMEVRGYYDPLNPDPWDFPKKIAQILCGARQDAEIKIGMYFIRAIGTMTQPGLKAGADPAGNLGSRPEATRRSSTTRWSTWSRSATSRSAWCSTANPSPPGSARPDPTAGC